MQTAHIPVFVMSESPLVVSVRTWSRSWRVFMVVCRQTGATTAGTASSATSASFSPDASTGPATSPGSATARGTGGACCATKVGVVV